MTVLITTRALVIPKERWRERDCRRTLEPVDIEGVLRRLALAPGVWSLVLNEDGSPQGPPVVSSSKTGVFDLKVEAGVVAVMLREDACLSRLGIPRRPARQIGTLRPWKILRVLLNGRMSDYSGQTYHVHEYCLLLCAQPAPAQFEPERVVDLQEDLS